MVKIISQVLELTDCDGITWLNYLKEDSIVKLDSLARVCFSSLGGRLVFVHLSHGTGDLSLLGHDLVHICRRIGGNDGLDAGYFSSPRRGFVHGFSGIAVVVGDRQFSRMGLVVAPGFGGMDLPHACMA